MKDFKKASEIVNDCINDFTQKDASMKTNEFCFRDASGSKLINLEVNNAYIERYPKLVEEAEEGIKVFDNIFSLKAPTMKTENRSFFHYKKFEYAYDFIDKEYISLSALSNFVDPFGDVKEYEHFFDIVNIGTSKSYIDEQKNGFYIFCLTDDRTTERFWEEYADYYKGLCIELEFEEKEKTDMSYDLRKVYYDDGYGFCFFKQMQDRIYKEYNKHLLIKGIAKFGAFYKRKKYDWEKETRLFINWKCYEECLKDSKIEIMPRTSKTFLKVPLVNDLFTVKIKSITVGKHLIPCQKEKIKNLAYQKGIACYEQ